jgi:hypothetical protein
MSEKMPTAFSKRGAGLREVDTKQFTKQEYDEKRL